MSTESPVAASDEAAGADASGADASGDRGSTRVVTTESQLDELYGAPLPRSLVKELDHVSDHYRVFIEKSPFVVVSTVGPEGLDCSPRGDPAGFVRVVDRHTLLLPDRRGNNRIDSLRNIVRDPRIALLFLIPGVGETLRVNGQARILADPDLSASFAVNGKSPATVIEITAERVYFQCQKALYRSRLWSAESHVDRSEVPSAGQILEALSDGDFDGAAYDRDYPGRMPGDAY